MNNHLSEICIQNAQAEFLNAKCEMNSNIPNIYIPTPQVLLSFSPNKITSLNCHGNSCDSPDWHLAILIACDGSVMWPLMHFNGKWHFCHYQTLMLKQIDGEDGSTGKHIKVWYDWGLL